MRKGGSRFVLIYGSGTSSVSGSTTSGSVSMTAAAGAFVLSGIANALTYQPAGAYVMGALPATFTHSGQDAAVRRTYIMAGEAGAFTHSGQAATFPRNYAVAGAAGAFTYTGIDATLTYGSLGAYSLTAAVGTFVLTGETMTTLVNYVLTSDAGTFTHTGQAATFPRNYVIAGATGAFTETGVAATLARSYLMAGAAGTFTYTGIAATLTYSAPVTSIAFDQSATSNAATVLVPSGVDAGDILVLADFVEGNVMPTSAVPSGFTSILDTNNGGTRKLILSYKKAAGTESGTNLAGMDGDLAGGEQKILLIFHPNVPANTITVGSAAGQHTAGDPTLQTVTSASATPPVIIIGVYAANASITTRSFTPAADGEVGEASNAVFWVKYKDYDTSPANVDVDMGDFGSTSFLQSCYLAVA